MFQEYFPQYFHLSPRPPGCTEFRRLACGQGWCGVGKENTRLRTKLSTGNVDNRPRGNTPFGEKGPGQTGRRPPFNSPIGVNGPVNQREKPESVSTQPCFKPVSGVSRKKRTSSPRPAEDIQSMLWRRSINASTMRISHSGSPLCTRPDRPDSSGWHNAARCAHRHTAKPSDPLGRRRENAFLPACQL